MARIGFFRMKQEYMCFMGYKFGKLSYFEDQKKSNFQILMMQFPLFLHWH